jgi:hypothetical protein
LAVGALALGQLALGSTAGAGQETDTLPPPRIPPEQSFLAAPAAPSRNVGPGGAFWRSLLVPGWGHAAVGAYGRGAFYFAGASSVGFMLHKSVSNRNAAQRVRDARASAVARELIVAGTPADSILILVEEDPRVQEAQDLRDVRGQQVQDWAALGIFIMLLSGADAFVSAHLMDFPEPLTLEVLPENRLLVGVRVPVPGPGG